MACQVTGTGADYQNAGHPQGGVGNTHYESPGQASGEDGDERTDRDPGVAGQQFGPGQQVRQDGVLHRTEQGGLQPGQEQDDEQKAD